MKKHIFSIVIIVLVLLLWNAGLAHYSREHDDSPSTLNVYDLVARGKMSQVRGNRPVQIARLDNNGEILLACLDPITTAGLKSKGIKFLQSQLELLVDWDLLEYDRKNKTYKTTIHVYGVEKTSVIRQQVDAVVKELTDGLNTDLVTLKNYLRQTASEKSLFAIFYAYVLHGYAMQQFSEEIYRKPQLSEEHPFWNGYSWAVYPAKKFKTGVISLPAEGNQFFIVPSDAIPRIDFRHITAFVKDIAADNRVDDPELIKSLSAFGLFDETGNLTVPVFDGIWSEKLESMAKTVYARIIELADSEEMKNILGMATQAQAAMFLHYEIRYAFLDYLLGNGEIPPPIDFENAANNSPSDVKNLVFLMKSEK